MKNTCFSPTRRALVVGGGLLLAGCAVQIPENAFLISEEMIAQRQMQSRRFEGLTEETALVASSNVLQDMGYNLEESEVALGVLTASKDRDAVEAGEIVGAIVMAALFGVSTPISVAQRIRVSLVVQPAGRQSVIAPQYVGGSGDTLREAAQAAVDALPEEEKTQVIDKVREPGDYVVRVTFQRVVTRTDNSTYVTTLDDPDVYQEFFDKLSKSVFIEAQQI